MRNYNAKRFRSIVLDSGASPCRGLSSCQTSLDARDVIPIDDIVPNLVMYFQVSCRSDEAQIEEKHLVGMAVACISAIIVVLYRVNVNDLDKNIAIDRKYVEIKKKAKIEEFTL